MHQCLPQGQTKGLVRLQLCAPCQPISMFCSPEKRRTSGADTTHHLNPVHYLRKSVFRSPSGTSPLYTLLPCCLTVKSSPPPSMRHLETWRERYETYAFLFFRIRLLYLKNAKDSCCTFISEFFFCPSISTSNLLFALLLWVNLQQSPNTVEIIIENHLREESF